MNISAADWSRLFKLLDTALELDEAARDTWIEQLDGDAAAFKAQLRELLDRHARFETAEFLAHPAQAAAALLASTLADSNTVLQAGAVVGAYTLVRELGCGGMGAVWLAERHDHLKRAVALKLPYSGPVQSQLAARFIRERDILAALTHPNIARLYDAGAADSGQPFLALEYVEGRPINEYCDAHQLSIRNRLKVFLQVLRAVQYAHANLVIHRDLKPNNILVTPAGEVKLLDFGIAKLLDPVDASNELKEPPFTQFGVPALTPDYAAPEQIAGGVISIASDVYSLGVMLFELLSGQRPYKLKRDSRGALEDAILNAQLQRPSQVDMSDQCAQARNSNKKALRKQLSGDLDALILKALKQDPRQRYATVDAFAQDIERYLSNQPVLAQPDSAWYRARKFASRNRLAVGSALLVAVALVAGVSVALWQAGIARREEQRAIAVQKFLTETLSFNDPEKARGRDLSARELLDLSAQQIDTQFAGNDAVRAQLHQTVGRIYIALGAIEQAQPHIDKAISLYEVTGERDSRQYVEALFSRAEAFDELSDFDAARTAALRTLAEAERAFGHDNEWAPRLLANLSWYDLHQGRFPEARELVAQALVGQRRLTGESSPDYRSIANIAANVYLNSDDLMQARDLFKENIRIGNAQLTHAEDAYSDGDRLMDRYNLARVRFTLFEFAAIEAELRNLVPAMEKHFGAVHDRTLVGQLLLAQTIANNGGFDEAVLLQRATLARAISRGIADDEAVALQQLGLALVLKTSARFDEATDMVRQGLMHFEANYPQPTTYRERARWILGESLLGQGMRDEGIATLRQALSNVDSMSKQNTRFLRAPMVLSLAVAERNVRDVSATCDTYEQLTGNTSIGSLRCRAIEAWLNALPAIGTHPAAALNTFITLRTRLFAALPDRHGLRAEMLAAEAEIVKPSNAKRAAALRAQAAAEYQRIFNRAMPKQLLMLH